jgi:hypothetical protein
MGGDATLTTNLPGRGALSAFADLVDEFLREHHAEHPVQSSTLGLTDYDNLLDDVSAAGFERRRAASAAWF